MFYESAFTELRTYIEIVRRRWPLILVPAVVVLVIGIVTFRVPPPTYETTVEYIVGQQPAPDTLTDEQARQWAWVVSQYVVNAVTDWAQGTDFAGRIADQLAVAYPELTKQFDLNTSAVATIISSTTIRSELTLVFEHQDEKVVEAVAKIATEVLQENDFVIPQLQNMPARVVPIDRVVVDEIAPPLFSYAIDLPLRLFVAIAAGIGLALLIEYVDPKVRSAAHIERMKLAMLGEIPAE
jgi:capsular polysaccharide biosynthesis protein